MVIHPNKNCKESGTTSIKCENSKGNTTENQADDPVVYHEGLIEFIKEVDIKS